MKKNIFYYIIFLIPFISCFKTSIYVKQKNVTLVNETLQDLTIQIIDSIGTILAINLPSNQADSISVIQTDWSKSIVGLLKQESYIKYKNIKYFETQRFQYNLGKFQILFKDGKKIVFFDNPYYFNSTIDSFFYGTDDFKYHKFTGPQFFYSLLDPSETTTKFFIHPRLYDSAR